jgi:hypothetical protein
VNISAVFIVRPVAMMLLTAGILLAGLMGFIALPVSPLPKVDFPSIQLQAVLPGASPDTVPTSVTTALEKLSLLKILFGSGIGKPMIATGVRADRIEPSTVFVCMAARLQGGARPATSCAEPRRHRRSVGASAADSSASTRGKRAAEGLCRADQLRAIDAGR